MEEGYKGVETSASEPIDPDENAINKILHSMTPGTSNFTNDCKELRRYSVHYNNAYSMASQQVT